MKLAFLVATRGNPERAAAVMECAKSLASGKHEIEYLIGCDRDDWRTHSWFWQNHPKMGDQVSIADRPNGVGAVWNRLCHLTKAEILCPFPDDIWIGSPWWDEIIVSEMLKIENPALRVIAWNDICNGNQCTLPIVSRSWHDLAGLYDDRFPFWFYDTAVDELHTFIVGRRVKIPPRLTFVSQKGKTQNLRDLAFWWDFYVATRQDRVAEAARIREQLGLEHDPSIAPTWLRIWENRDKIGRSTAIEVEKALTAEGRKPPSPQYLKAKDMAEAYLNTKKAITPAPADDKSSEIAA